MPSCRRSVLLVLAILASTLVLSSCGGEPPAMSPTTGSPLSAVSSGDWARLAATRILFGHQSVGNNILRGVQELLQAHPEIRLEVVERADLPDGAPPQWAHFAAGQNTRPDSKVDDFVARVAASPAPPDLAFLKFCYIDVNAATDVARVFEHYRAQIEQLRARAGGTTIVHFTMPLRVVQDDWKVPVKRLIGRPIGGYADNVKRNEYNDLVRAAYAGKEPLFDLAAVESTRPDGSRVTFETGGRTYFALAPEYSDDGGHLNALGRRVVAEALLVELARIAGAR